MKNWKKNLEKYNSNFVAFAEFSKFPLMPTPLLLLLLTVAAYASVWNGKTDTAWHNESETEFTITTPEQLAGFAELVNSGNNFEGKMVKLGANIMLNDTANWQSWASSPPANEWVPIGENDESCSDSPINSFNGIFDGNGFTVSGVYINSEIRCRGLFGYIGSNGAIKKLGVVASYIKGEYNTGGLVGYNHDGTISDNYFTGMVTGGSNAGGLIGYNNDNGTISNGYSSGNVTGELNVGGLAGRNGCGIEGRAYGGEMLWTGGTITNSHSKALVTGKENIGGLVGSNGHGTISNSYSTGMVTGEEKVGGLIGENPDYATKGRSSVINSYSTGMVTGKSYVGGLVGDNNGTVSNSYYDKQASKSRGNDGIGKTMAEMQSKEFADSLNFMAGLLSANAWVYSSGKYPVLSEQVASWPNMDRFFAGGNGTEANPYVISTKKHLENLAYFVNSGVDFLGKHIKLSQNIAINIGWRTSKWISWTSIGKGERSFQGTFDGNGFAVSGISGSSGLFGVVGSSGTIKNLGATDVYIKKDDYAGGLVYYNEGTIINCYSTGRIAVKYDFAGGLVGCNCGDSSRIINSYSTVSVSGQNYIGGLAGTNEGFISGSYSTGKVNGKIHHLTQTLSDLCYLIPRRPNRSAGGLVGDNQGTIINSHSSSDVTGIEYVGGLVGSNEGTISGSYCTGKVNKNYLVGAGKEAVDSSYYCNEKK